MPSIHVRALLFAALVVPTLQARPDEFPAAAATTTWIVPSAAHYTPGAGWSLWTTGIIVTNPTNQSTNVTFKFLGHDVDGTGGDEVTFNVPEGRVLPFFNALVQIFGIPLRWGAIRITSPLAGLVIQTETSWTLPGPYPGGGTVGQTVPALGAADFVGAERKTLAPIREFTDFRTNLVLANATEAPLTAHLALYDEYGGLLGERDVDLPPLGMTQLSRVASSLGGSDLFAGRLSVSTPTPGGLVAAYASVIDNTTNDPRTLLPR